MLLTKLKNQVTITISKFYALVVELVDTLVLEASARA